MLRGGRPLLQEAICIDFANVSDVPATPLASCNIFLGQVVVHAWSWAVELRVLSQNDMLKRRPTGRVSVFLSFIFLK